MEVDYLHQDYGLMGKGDHSETLLLQALFYQNSLSGLKVIGGGGGVG